MKATLNPERESMASRTLANFTALVDALSQPGLKLDWTRLTDGFWPGPPEGNTQEEYRQWVLTIAKKTVELLETPK